ADDVELDLALEDLAVAADALGDRLVSGVELGLLLVLDVPLAGVEDDVVVGDGRLPRIDLERGRVEALGVVTDEADAQHHVVVAMRRPGNGDVVAVARVGTKAGDAAALRLAVEGDAVLAVAGLAALDAEADGAGAPVHVFPLGWHERQARRDVHGE